MPSTQLNDEKIEIYMARLQAAMARVLPADRDDIVREIHAHIVESIAGAEDRDKALDRVLWLLGSPEELASRYTTESLLARASRSFSPWLLIRTCWRWAQLGMKGILAFLLAVFGYVTALALTVSVFLKPFLPTRIGLWVGPEGLNVGIPSHP